jgi:integrase
VIVLAVIAAVISYNHVYLLVRRYGESDLPVAPERVGRITGQIDGHLWREEPIAVDELPHLVLMLTAGCFVVICYLSGMRPGEVLNLRRGCRRTDERTGELLLRGQIGKGRDRQPPADGAEPGNEWRWAVVGPVHTAVAMLEDLKGQDLLFPTVVTHPGPRPDNGGQARKQPIINANIQQFIDWARYRPRGPWRPPESSASSARHPTPSYAHAKAWN